MMQADLLPKLLLLSFYDSLGLLSLPPPAGCVPTFKDTLHARAHQVQLLEFCFGFFKVSSPRNRLQVLP